MFGDPFPTANKSRYVLVAATTPPSRSAIQANGRTVTHVITGKQGQRIVVLYSDAGRPSSQPIYDILLASAESLPLTAPPSAVESARGAGRAGAVGAVVGGGATAISMAATGQKIELHDPTKLHATKVEQDVCWFDSYGNGGGIVASGCPPDREWRDSMCYMKCGPGETGSMTMCKKACPAGYRTDALTCWGETIKADNSKCPWYDKCGLGTNCSKCPRGFKNTGCFCEPSPKVIERTHDVGIGMAGTIEARINNCQRDDV